MAISLTYTWKIHDIERYYEYNGYQNVVSSAKWQITCNGDNGSYSESASKIGVQEIPFTEFSTPYESLTESDVINWIKIAMGNDAIQSIESELSTEVDAKFPKTTWGVPWSV